MDTTKICSGCQKPLEANAPDGLCPECLLKAGLGTGVDLGPDSQAQSGRTAFVAPSVEEVARLFPQVEMLGFVGQGGMGAVYKARQKALDRIVALKILPPGIGKDPAFTERFTREAKALAKLNHTGIVTLYEFGQADGLFFFLMEFVDGMSLRHLLEVERISAREALAIVPQICDALQYAHDQGIVHRDIKPENILLDRQGRVKVADFGLAKLAGTDALTPTLSLGGGEGAAALTDAGKVMGTPQYMAPEQREHPTEVDHRADIYSLGVVFYQMLTGELPGKPIEVPSSRMRGMQIDVRLDEIVLRALEKEPQRRYQQVSQMGTAVETMAHTPDAAKPANRTDNAAPRLLKGDAGFVTTPEQLGTLEGQLFLWQRRSQLLLDERQLTISRAGAFTVIPLAAIRDLSIGHYGRVMHPVGLDFISVTYDSDGQTQRLYFSPYESWFGLPSTFNRIVAEWFNAIRAAVVAATGREPGNTPAEQLGVPPGSKALYALLLAPLVLGATLLVGVLLRGQRVGEAATHLLPGGLAIFFFAMLVLAVGFITFLVVRAVRKSAAESISSSASPVTDTAPSPARPAALRGRLRAALMVGVLVWLFVTGTATLITWIRPGSWKVVAVINCPHKSQPGRPIGEHFKFTAAMIGLIQSDVILGRVIDRLQWDERSGKLDERWGKRNLGLKLTKAQAMVLLKRRLDVRSEGGTLIQVGVFGQRPEEPEEAMDIANTIAEELRAFRLEQQESPADMLEMTLRFTPPHILLGLAAGLVPGLLAGGLVLRRGFWRRGPQASQGRMAVETIAQSPQPAGSGQAAFAGDRSAVAAVLQTAARPRPAWSWIVVAVAAMLLIPVLLLGLSLYVPAHNAARQRRLVLADAQRALAQARLAAGAGQFRAQSLNRVVEVRNGGPKTAIRAELDDAHELCLMTGGMPLGSPARQPGSTSAVATVEVSSALRFADGNQWGRELIFEAWGVRRTNAINTGSPNPYDRPVGLRPNGGITCQNGIFTFADIRQTNGTLVPVSVCVRPVPRK